MSHILQTKASFVRSGRSSVGVDRNVRRSLINPYQYRARRGNARRSQTRSSIVSPRPIDDQVASDGQKIPTSSDVVDSESLLVADNDLLSICVVGASGDLAKKKVFPSLFSLYYKGYLPKNFEIWGYARSKLSIEDFKKRISENLSCRLGQGIDCGKKMEEFLERCFYVSGGYDSLEGFGALDEKMCEQEKSYDKGHRIFYLSIPPNVFVDSAQTSAIAASSRSGGFTRLIVEKPFGRDSASSKELDEGLQVAWEESQIYRIDHYLGKELVENLMVLRFSNLIFEPLWNRKYVKCVQLIFSENFGTDGRGGYFDQYGIVRDIMQNHLLQCLALVAMEPPVSLNAEDIVSEKIKLLKCMEPIKPDDVVIGQYKNVVLPNGKNIPGYLDDDTVPNDSITPTFAAAAMYINNTRWAGVPFLMKAGKALDKRIAEIRIQFDSVRGGVYEKIFNERSSLSAGRNELVIRIQPDEAIYMRINNKVPGLEQEIEDSTLDLLYRSQYAQKDIPDAYERLILDVIEGDKSLFIRNDELDQAWKLFTPILHYLEDNQVQPELYPFGSRGPIGARYLADRYGIEWGEWNEE